MLAARAGKRPGDIRLEDGQIEQMTMLGLAAEGRGLFYSPSGGVRTPARHSQELELINTTLAPLDGMLATSRAVPSEIGSDANATCSLLRSNDGGMLLRFSGGNAAGRQRGSLSDGLSAASTILIPGIPETTDVFRWTPAGMEPLQHRRVAGGVRVSNWVDRGRTMFCYCCAESEAGFCARGANRHVVPSCPATLRRVGRQKSRRAAAIAGNVDFDERPRSRAQDVAAAGEQMAVAKQLAQKGDLVGAFGATTVVREQLDLGVGSLHAAAPFQLAACRSSHSAATT